MEATLEQYMETSREMEWTEKAEIHLAVPEDSVVEDRTTPAEDRNADLDTQYDTMDSSQIQPDQLIWYTSTDLGGAEQCRALVALLESGLQFARCMAGVVYVLKEILASPSASSYSEDVKHAITLLILARQFEIDGAEESVREMLLLYCNLLAAPAQIHSKFLESAICRFLVGCDP